MTDIGLGGAHRVQHEAPPTVEPDQTAQAFVQAQPQDPHPFAPPTTLPPQPVNPYAPTGWRKKRRVEFDLEMPSGQMCRVMRLERDDLLRLNLIEHLDTFTPMLMDTQMDDAERQAEIRETIQDKPEALNKMLLAVDKVVMSATIRPRITDDRKKVNYGTERDWNDPNFTATVHLDDIDMFERMYIFGAAFGRSMDDLKSVFEQTPGLDSLADVSSVQQNPE